MEASKKFGTFTGVFVPSFEAIIGTVLFLLLPLLTAQAGLVWMLVIVLVGHTVTLSTTASLSDCVTNLNRIGGGGLYAICKESLGKALGGAIGISLFLAQVASIGFYLIGFTDTLFPLVQSWWEALLPATMQLQSKPLLASAFLLIFCIIVLVGADFVVKLQNIIFIILGISLIALFISPFLGLKSPQSLGAELPLYSSSLNLWGNKAMTISLFFICFTQFFPAVTGISAGIGMSGDLRTPQRSIVYGTFTAVIVTFVIYIAITVIFSFLNPVLFQGRSPLLTELFGMDAPFPRRSLTLLVLVGILVATASSGLSLFVTGPRTLQSIIYDRLLPRKMSRLAWDFRRGGREPRWAILLSFVMALGVIWSGDLNFAATLVGILFLLVYAWVNGAAFLERISRSPTFRPSFKGHWGFSLYGLCSSVLVIALYNWLLGVILVLSQMLIFHLLMRYKTNGALQGVWWGLLFNAVNRATQKLRKKQARDHKNWRPIVQAIAVDSQEESEGEKPWQDMANFALQIGEFGGFVEFHLLQKEKNQNREPEEAQNQAQTSKADAATAQGAGNLASQIGQGAGNLASQIGQGASNLASQIGQGSGMGRKKSSKPEPSLGEAKPSHAEPVEQAERSPAAVQPQAVIPEQLLSRIHSYSKKASDLASQIVEHSGLVIAPNTLLLEANEELDILPTLRLARDKSWHSILYRPARRKRGVAAKPQAAGKSIDVWWYNESNGNFMLILAYMINQHRRMLGKAALHLRLFHYLDDNDVEEERQRELAQHLRDSRLEGEVMVLAKSEDKTFIDMMSDYSSQAVHVFAGLPGKQADSGTSRKRFWDFDEFFFERMIKNFSPEVSVYFVKCAGDFHLITD